MVTYFEEFRTQITMHAKVLVFVCVFEPPKRTNTMLVHQIHVCLTLVARFRDEQLLPF